MADNSYGVLGQSAPAAATPADLYTVAAATEAIGSTIVVCNRSATATKFRISVRPLGAAQADEHYIYYDIPISGNNAFHATIGMTLAATDVVTVYATLATLSFTLFGQEIA
jgi:hypothetical protein